jgi:hypothetical protein
MMHYIEYKYTTQKRCKYYFVEVARIDVTSKKSPMKTGLSGSSKKHILPHRKAF